MALDDNKLRGALCAFALGLASTEAALAACPPGMRLTSLGRTADDALNVWRITNQTTAAEQVRLRSVGTGFVSPYFTAPPDGGIVIQTTPRVPGANTTQLTDGCGVFQTRAAGDQIYNGPLQPDPNPNPNPNPDPGPGPGGGGTQQSIFAVVSQATVASYVARSQSISDRVISGLFSRERIGRARTSDLGGRQYAQAAPASRPDVPPVSRELVLEAQPDWNAWVDGRYLDVDDRRYGLSTDGYYTEASFGIDRLVGTDMTLGVAVAPERLDLEGYGRTVKLKGTGFTVGPYVGYRVAPNVIVDAWAGYSRIDTDLDIGTVTGSYKTDRWFGAATVTSQHAVGLVNVRPKLSAFISHDRANGFTDSTGQAVADESFTYASGEASLGVNRIYRMAGDALVQPYVRFGVRYDFRRPLDGQILDPSGQYQDTSRWSGSTRVGARMLVSNRIVLEGNVGYLSMFQGGLDIWEYRLAVSTFF